VTAPVRVPTVLPTPVESVTELTIPRSTWLRGEGAERSALLRPDDGRMCCLGLYLQACGIPRPVLTGRATAIALVDRGYKVPYWLYQGTPGENAFMNSRAAAALMGINDWSKGTEEHREAEVKRMFKEQGITVTFVP
jgi:hypothetical protein